MSFAYYKRKKKDSDIDLTKDKDDLNENNIPLPKKKKRKGASIQDIRLHIPDEQLKVDKKKGVNLIKSVHAKKKSARVKKKNVSKSVKMHIPDEEESADLKFGIDLVPQKIIEVSRADIIKTAVILLVVFIFMASISVFAYFYIQKKIVDAKRVSGDVSFQISSIDKEIELYEKNKKPAEELQVHIAITKSLIKNHVYLSNLFDFLENLTLKNVYYKSMALDRNIISLQVLARDYETMSRQLKSFEQNKKIFNVTLRSLDLADEQGTGKARKLVSGEISIKFDPDVLKYINFEN